MAPNDTSSTTPVAEKQFSRVFPETDDDEIVISGMSGRFPNSKNIAEYENHLYNKVDMVDDDERRWKHFSAEIPNRFGKINDLGKFDATFFGVHFKQAHTMDPQCRMLIETAYECVLDAGVNPKQLRGSKTGVYIGGCLSESEKTWFYEKISSGGFGITGCSRAMLANRISYCLGLYGPSYLIDTACSSAMYALDNAFSAFRNGEIDGAIIGGANLILHPYVSLQFARLGVLAADGYCRPFDQDASGYARGEAINCLFLQRRRDAKRVYATIVYSKTNCDGYKQEGITFPSGLMQEKLLREFYKDLDLDLNQLGYLEAHSTGTILGDPEECRAIDSAICKRRKHPLLVGSVKSNIGHTEAASGICSIVKCCLAFQNGKVPPNINFKKPKSTIPALSEGRLRVCSEIETLDSPYIGVNSFGFGGANAHCLLKACPKDKKNFGIPDDNLPRLVCWAGRSDEGVNALFKDIESRPLDAELVALLQNIQRDPISGFVFRGYGLYEQEGLTNAKTIVKEVQHYTGLKRPIVWVFSGMGSQWTEMGTAMMQIPAFHESIQKSHNVLKTKGIDLINILTIPDPTTYDNILHSFVGIAACQIAIVDILRLLDMEPDFVIGHSVGELGCAYADGGFTAEQMILSSYSRGKASVETEKIFGSMAAVGLGYRNIVKLLPPTIEVACHNSADSSTISGPAEEVAKFVAELKAKGIFAKEVPCSNIAYHSRYISQMGPTLLKYLREIIPNPKKRTEKWLSSSIPKSQWETAESQLCSADYHTNNLLSSVLFEETSALLPSNALTIEIAPHGLLQAILKKSMPNSVHTGLTQRGNKNNHQFFFTALGKLFLNGIDLPIDRLYPTVKLPVSRGTPTISSLIRWDHSEDWYVTKFENIKSDQSGERVFKVGVQNDDEGYLSGHVIDGRIMVPATGYLQYVWETFSSMRKVPVFTDIAVEFEDVRFLRATQLQEQGLITFTVMIHHGTGNFEVTESGALVCTGVIREILNPQPPTQLPPLEPSSFPIIPAKDFYKELRLRGYHYSGAFKSVIEARGDGLYGKAKWESNWVSFMDCMLQLYIIGTDSRSLVFPTRIQKLRINGQYHTGLLSQMDSNKQSFDVQVCTPLERIVGGGVEIIGVTASAVSRRRPPGFPVLEKYQFLPHFPAPKLSTSNAVRVCVQLALENNVISKVKGVEVDLNSNEPIIQHIHEALEDLPLVSGDLMFLSTQDLEITGVHVEDGKLSTQTNCLFIISSKLLSNDPWVNSAQNSMGENAYLISREESNFDWRRVQPPAGFNFVAVLPTEDETLVLCQRVRRKQLGAQTIVQISQTDLKFTWVQKVQSTLARASSVLLYAENEKLNGILGLVNCLRKEPNGQLVTCVLIDDPNAPDFSIDLPIYKNHLMLGLTVNIYRNGHWGTYRHLQLTQVVEPKPQRDQIYAKILQRGDLSSVSWLEGPLLPENVHIRICYSAINFRDVMLATGQLPPEIYGQNRLNQLGNLGLEIAGVAKNGKRYMGMVKSAGFASVHDLKPSILWEVPDTWSLQEACTVPVAYMTVYYAFFFSADIRKGKTILIHAGTGGVGLCAIRTALAYGLEVFTTVGSPEKKEFLLQNFSQLNESHIGNSRDTTFESMIRQQTDGKGVDFVLNSLAEDKLLASIRCLGHGGHFLEIGKFDMANDNKIGLGQFLNELSFHAVLAENLFTSPQEFVQKLKDHVERDISAGIITPLPVTVFKANAVDKALRYMITGKHIGKVVLELRSNEKDEYTHPIRTIPQVYFNPNLVYVIPGGLGGFGLELADWMCLRGARKLVLNSRQGISKPYQTYRIKLWESYGAHVVLNTNDITTSQGCEQMLKAAAKLGPIGGIFNLAVALRDSIFKNQTSQTFAEVLAPKAQATQFLDLASRKLCPQLKHFVVFSSVSCGRGSAGQTNYGMANSVMERIIEDRAKQGLPAKAIQWGAVGEVGLVADLVEDRIDMEINGTLQQRISSCLQELDALLVSPDPIVSSMVVAEKHVGRGGSVSLIDTIMHIMSIRDLRSISMTTTLSEMGMDSLMGIDIKQTLEREYELSVTPNELRSLTFQKLRELSDARDKETGQDVKLKLANDNKRLGMDLLLRNLGDETNSGKTILPTVTKNSNILGLNSSIIIPGIEGVGGQTWYNIALDLHSHNYLLQLTQTSDCRSVDGIVQRVFESVKQIFKKTEPFYLVGYSFGALITLRIAQLLEKQGYFGQILLIDGAPKFLKKLFTIQLGDKFDETELQLLLFSIVVNRIFPDERPETIVKHFVKLGSLEERMQKLKEFCEKQNVYSTEYASQLLSAIYNRIRIIADLKLEDTIKLKAPITLVRPSEVAVVEIEEDYELSKYTSGKITLKFIEGDHSTMLENRKLPGMINESDPNIESDKIFEIYLNQ